MSKPSDQQAEKQNQRLWDELASVHLEAYEEVKMLREGREILDVIELADIGPVRGKSLLHLQCHIGTDSLAWARQGAVVTGIDFSEESIRCARQLSEELDLPARFIQSSVYDVRTVDEERYDIVYTSRGVLCWLRDLQEWGRIVADSLKPGGLFYLMETHPLLAAMEEVDGVLVPTYPYFHQTSPMEWTGDGDYADPGYISKTSSLEWQWSVSDILHALLDAGLQIDLVKEYDRLFFKMFPSMTTEDGRWFRMPEHEDKLPLLLTVRAGKPA